MTKLESSTRLVSGLRRVRCEGCEFFDGLFQ